MTLSISDWLYQYAVTDQSFGLTGKGPIVAPDCKTVSDPSTSAETACICKTIECTNSSGEAPWTLVAS
jgi:hypothetical protein